ncbi:MAG: hypothetical protein H6519_03465 [Microthrixaceae bacterium]|nr:hypothetical protein [Acidimicrobiales bacterium]MCB9403474.1 hypothetical protein [Microthrixaceae bacterium]
MAVAAPDLASLTLLGQRIRPVTGATERVLEVPEVLADLLPHRGLQRGSLVATGGTAASSLALALVGPTSAAGGWVAAVGLPHLGLVAAAELGVDLERVLLVEDPGPTRWAASLSALLDAVEVVLCLPPRPVTAGVQRRLTAQARDRGSVIVQVGGTVERWAGTPDLVVEASAARWRGVGSGHGHLRGRLAQVSVTGRRGAHRPRRAHLWLPAPGGGVSAVSAVSSDESVPSPSPPSVAGGDLVVPSEGPGASGEGWNGTHLGEAG